MMVKVQVPGSFDPSGSKLKKSAEYVPDSALFQSEGHGSKANGFRPKLLTVKSQPGMDQVSPDGSVKPIAMSAG